MSERETALKEPCPHCGRTDYRWTHEFRARLSFSPEDRLEVRCDYCRPLRMDAYYFGFTETGVRAIDRILSAVAQAGKGYHHTESWSDDGLDDMGEFHGGSYIAWIQNAANDAAKAFAALPGDAPRLSRAHFAALTELADDLSRIVAEVSSRDGDATARQHQRAEAVRAAVAALHPGDAPQQWPAVVGVLRRAVDCLDSLKPGDPDAEIDAEIESLIGDIGAILRDAPPVCEWRDIATAPKDGTRILLTPAVWTAERVVSAYYRLGLWWIESVDVHGSMRAFTDPDEDASHWPFTHWQPLPLAPSPAQE